MISNTTSDQRSRGNPRTLLLTQKGRLIMVGYIVVAVLVIGVSLSLSWLIQQMFCHSRVPPVPQAVVGMLLGALLLGVRGAVVNAILAFFTAIFLEFFTSPRSETS